AREVDESIGLDAFEAAHNEIRRICAMQHELRAEVGKPNIEVTYTPKYTDELFHELMTTYGNSLRTALLTSGKQARSEAVKAVKAQMLAAVPIEETEKLAAVGAAYSEMETRIFRDVIAKEQKRLDGRD